MNNILYGLRGTFFFCCLSIFFCSPAVVWGQADTAFWFAAPEVSAHDAYGRDKDRPILMRIITLNSGATVTISQPAGGGMPNQTLTLAANSTDTVDLTNWIDFIENKPGDQILNYGLKVKSDVPIIAYYIVLTELDPSANKRTNPEIYSLKGKEALGTNFWIPGQNTHSSTDLIPLSYNSFNIVATKDNTQVTITPKKNITGHSAGSPFTITLNKGQTYAARATSQTGANHLAGSTVTANNPIAITVSDDANSAYGGDLIGDQIVPAQYLGTEYIALTGWLNTSSGAALGNYGDDLYVLGTQNNTSISDNGIAVATINAGETYLINTNGQPATYISSSAPVALWQFSGVAAQPGASQVPHLGCNGSNKVKYVFSIESQPNDLLFNIVVPKEGRDSFLFNGNPGIINGSMFQPVPGTGGNWYYCQYSVTTPVLNVGDIVSLENTSTHFQLEVVEGSVFQDQDAWGANIGYFTTYNSDISGDSLSFSLGSDTSICKGDQITLDASGSGASNYIWNTGATTSSITIGNAGTYWVKASSLCATGSDTINVNVIDFPKVDLGPDLTLCPGQTVTLNATVNNAIGYQWSTGATTSSIVVNTPGIYSVTAYGQQCASSDTIKIDFTQPITLDLGDDTTVCQGSKIVLNPHASNAENLLWSTNETTPTITVDQGGLYWVKASSNCDTLMDSIMVNMVKCDCHIGVPNAFTPNGDGLNDLFLPVIGPGCRFKYYNFSIYDRFGQRIFHTQDPNEGWTGSLRAKHYDVGSYFYIIQYILDNPEPEAGYKKGDVSLIR